MLYTFGLQFGGMSLIIARKIGRSACIISDTLLLPVNAKPRMIDVELKAVILNPDLVVAYAGVKYFADEALRRIDTNATKEAICAFFLESHYESSGQTDFILAFGQPEPHLFCVKGGMVENVTDCWIGDVSAFEGFQTLFHGNEESDGARENCAKISVQRIPEGHRVDQEAFGRLTKTFQQLLGSNVCPSIGGFVVPIAYDRGRWRYMDYLALLSHVIDWRKLHEGKEDQWVPLPLGDAAEGGYAVNFIGSESGFPNGAALYFRQGAFGVVYHFPGGERKRELISPEIGPIDFEDICWLKYGLKLKTMFSGATEYAARGWKKFLNGDVGGAESDLQRALELEPGSFMIHYAKALIFEKCGQMAEAEKSINQSLSLNPNFPGSYNVRGVINARMLKFELALSDFSKTLELDPSFEEAKENIKKLSRDHSI